MPRLPRPDGEFVRRLHSRLVKDWEPRLKLDRQYRDLIRGIQKIETLDKDAKRNIQSIELHSGRAGGLIEHANGLLQAMPSFHANPFSLETDDLREAEIIERAAARFFEQQLLGNEFWGGVSRDVLAYGRAYIKTLTSPSEWIAQAGYPVRKKGESGKAYLARIRIWKDGEANFPFIISQIPSLNLLAMVDQNNHIEASLEEKFVPAHIIADDMGSKTIQELIKNRSIDWYDQLSVMEYIDLDWVGYFLTSTDPRDPAQQYDFHTRLKEYETLRSWQHNMGIHPIVLIPGITTGDQEFEHRFRSFIADAKEDLEAYDKLISRLMTMVWAHYLPSYIWELGTASKALDVDDRPDLPINLGGTTVLTADEKIYPLPIQPNLPPAELLMQQVDDMIQRLTIEDVLYGRVQGAAPAYQVNLRIQVARSKLSPIAQHMANGITNVIERLFRGIEALGEAVSIDGETITTDMAKRFRNRVTASITPKSPIDRSQDIGTAIMAYRDLGMPWDWVVEHILDVEDPATLRLMNDIRKLEESESAQARLQQDALEQLNLLLEGEDFEDVANISQEELTPEFMQAIGQIQEEQGTTEGTGLGRGPFPEGAAPQTIAPRGLNTPNRQPQPGTVQINSQGGII